MKQIVMGMLLAVCSTSLLAGKPCEELGAEISAKLDAKGVKNYTLEAVSTDKVGAAQTVVGSCDAGKSKLVYSRGKASSAPAPVAATPPAATPAAAPDAAPAATPAN